MNVMGIDSNSFGFHWVLHRDPGMIISGSFVGQDADARMRRMATFDYAIDVFSGLPQRTHVWLEEALVLPKNIETTRKLVMIAGTIEAAFWQAAPQAWLWSVDISSWRKAVLGKGGGRKDEMKMLANHRVSLHSFEAVRNGVMPEEEANKILADDNFCDAYCLMLYGLDQKPTAA